MSTDAENTAAAAELPMKSSDSTGEQRAGAQNEGDTKIKRGPKVLQASWSKSRLEKQPEIEVTDDDELKQSTQSASTASVSNVSIGESGKGASVSADQFSSSESNCGSTCEASCTRETAGIARSSSVGDRSGQQPPCSSSPSLARVTDSAAATGSQPSSVRSASQSPNRGTTTTAPHSLTLEGANVSVCSSGCSLSRDSSTDTQNSMQMAPVNQNPADIEDFLKTAFAQSQRNRNHILKFESELSRFMLETNKTEHKFQPLSSYHRMLLHRMAIWFGLEHAIDPANKKCVMVTKTPNSRTPTYSFVEAVANEQATGRVSVATGSTGTQVNDETASQKSSSTTSRSSARHRHHLGVLKRSDEHVNSCSASAAFSNSGLAIMCPGSHVPAACSNTPYQHLLLAAQQQQQQPGACSNAAFCIAAPPRRVPIDEKDEETERTRSRLLALGGTATSTPRSHGPGSVASSTKSHTSQHSRGSASAREADYQDESRYAGAGGPYAASQYRTVPQAQQQQQPPQSQQHYHHMVVPTSHRHWSSTESASLLEPPPARVVNLASMQKAGSFGGVPGIYIQLQQSGANAGGTPNSPAMPLVRQEACNHTSFGLMRQDTAVDQATPTGPPPNLHPGMHMVGMPPTCPCCASIGTASSTSGSMSLCEEQSIMSSVNGEGLAGAPCDEYPPFALEPNRMVFWVASTLDCVPPGALLIDPYTGAPYVRSDGSLYRFDRSHMAGAMRPNLAPAAAPSPPARFAPAAAGPTPPVTVANIPPYTVRPPVGGAASSVSPANNPAMYTLGGPNSDTASQASSADSLRFGMANIDLNGAAQAQVAAPPPPQPDAAIGMPPNADGSAQCAPMMIGQTQANGQPYATYSPYVPCVSVPYVTTMFVPLEHFAPTQQSSMPLQWLASPSLASSGSSPMSQPPPQMAEDAQQRVLNPHASQITAARQPPQRADALSEASTQQAVQQQQQYVCASHFYRASATSGQSPVQTAAVAQVAYPTNASPVDKVSRT